MYQKLRATICCLVLSCALYGQNGWVPPVTIPANAYLCDPSSWKLVLFDDFNGSHIDTTKWKTYTTWDGMRVVRNTDTFPKPDHPDWDGARTIYNNALFKDDNVVVSGGTCKLLLKNDPYTSWHYIDSTQVDTITHTIHPDSTLVRHLSGGCINTPFKLSNGSPNHFNSGRFEAKIKFPIFKGAWCAFWLWHGSTVNEIDIAEAWGGVGYPYIGSRPHNTYNLHAWRPPAPPPPTPANPYNLPEDVDLSNYYPNQSWWDFITDNPNRHRQNYWHTYTCEWDTASIKTYLDFNLVNTIWKYYQDKQYWLWEYKNGSMQATQYTYQEGSGCNPDPGTWQITYGYPYNSTNSESHLRLSNGFTDEQQGDANGGVYTRDAMEIDYVKIWQKHPEQDGHIDLCSGSITPVITGPSVVCGTQAYSVSPVQAGGTWSLSNDAVFFGGGTPNGSTKLIYPNANSPYTHTVLSYTYQPATPGCPPVTVSKLIQTTVSTPYITCSRNWNWFTESFTLIAAPILTGATYSWEIDYGINSNNLNHYTATGPIVHTSSMNHWGIIAYYVKWKLTITTSCGQKVIQGVKNNMSYLAPTLAKASTYMERDSSAWYFETRFTEQDSLNYDRTVHNKVAQLMVAEGTDTIEIISFINKAKAEALEPYLYFEEASTSVTMKGVHQLPIAQTNESRLYPNPANDHLFIDLATSFNKNEAISIEIYDLIGKLVQSQSVFNAAGTISIDISHLEEGSYTITLSQNMHNEHHKLVKQK